jgi:tRNA nucleotidyltransferase (CCA-adding enzyme)
VTRNDVVVAERTFLRSIDALLPPEVLGAIRSVGALAATQGVRAHVVGGFVRDMLLGRGNLDVDIVVEGDGIAMAMSAAARLTGTVTAHPRFGTAVVRLSPTLHLDIASARTEHYVRPGALPTVARGSLNEDLLRRDITINAMAASIDPEGFGTIADPSGGLDDLGNGVVRVLHPLSFVEDPTRIMRAARFEARYGFAMEPSTLRWADAAIRAGSLARVSGTRIRAELFAVLAESPALAPLARLDELGALVELLPAGVAPSKALSHVAALESSWAELPTCAGRALQRRVALLAAMAVGSSPDDAEKWVRWLRLARLYGGPVREMAERGPAVARSLVSRSALRDSALYALLHPLAPESLAVLWALGEPAVRERVGRYLTELSHVRAAVSGADLLALGAQPSPVFSAILEAALADRLDMRAVGREAELANLRRLAARFSIPRKAHT